MKKIVANLLLLALIASSFAITAQDRLSFSRKQSFKHMQENAAPQSLERRAADILEQQRFAGEADWYEAKLTGEVTPLYRPDFDEPAYFEFAIEPNGFMILSTGQHDYPLTLLSKSGDQTPSQRLQEQAEGREIARIYVLDSLSFAAESPDGELVATLGTLPMRLVPLAPGEKQAPLSVESFLMGGEDDDMPAEVVTEEGPMVDLPYDLVAWESWQELKDNYRETYAEMLEQQAEAAAFDWDTELAVEAFGEGIPVGTAFLVPLLNDESDFHVEGEGANFAEVTRLQRPGMADVIAIQPFEAVEGADLTLHLFYPDREPENADLLLRRRRRRQESLAHHHGLQHRHLSRSTLLRPIRH